MIIGFVVVQESSWQLQNYGALLEFPFYSRQAGIILLRMGIRDRKVQPVSTEKKHQFRYYGISALWFCGQAVAAPLRASGRNTGTP